jgi:hypothetical protein
MEADFVAWKCEQCGKTHDDAAESYGFDEPLPWSTLTEAERGGRSILREEFCILNDTHFFIRGCLEIPVIDGQSAFVWGVWVSLSSANFDRSMNLWEDPKRVDEPPYFGWLSSRIPLYPDTFLLKTRVHTRELGLRRRIELEPTSHLLSIEQRQGITRDRLREIASLMEHDWVHPKWDCN